MKQRILVVEDEPVVALDIRRQLREMGYDVAGMASSGEDAMLAAGELRPDAVLMDVSLGTGMDGIEAATRIRGLYHIPVVFLTAYADEDLLVRMKLSDPFAYVLKPFEYMELHAALEIALLRSGLERSVNEEHQLLSATLKSIDDGVVVTGESGTIRFMNPVAEALTGWNQEDAAGKDLGQVYVIEPPDTLVARDGMRRTVDHRSNMIIDADGRWSGFVYAFSDITERETARKSVYQREQEYRMLMEQAADAIVVADVSGRIRALNQRVCDLLEYPRKELMALSLTDLLLSEQTAEASLHLASLTSGTSLTINRRLQCKSGRVVAVEVSVHGLSDGRIQAVLHEITGQEAGEEDPHDVVRSEAVERLLRRLHALAYGERAATTLSRLALFLQNIESLRAPSASAEAKALSPLERFRQAVAEFHRAVVPQLLRISTLFVAIETDHATHGEALGGLGTRLSAATQTLHTRLPDILLLVGDEDRDSDLRDQVRDACLQLEEVCAVIRQARTVLTTDFTCDAAAVVRLVADKFLVLSPSITVSMDSARPASVIMNGSDLSDVLSRLITGALEASQESSPQTVGVRLCNTGRRLVIEVEDNGPGISAGDRGRIFDETVHTKPDGCGTRLGRARRCLEGFGGELRLDHTGASGTRFSIELTQVTLPHGPDPHH
jgi:PAS domain S-box-containing protein